MKLYVVEYLVALGVFLAFDFAWLKTMGPAFYAPELGALLRPSPNLVVALAFYMLFVFGLVVFVIHPALTMPSGGLSGAVMRAALFGLVAYATYDLTNLATISGFTARVAVVDMAWGAVLSAAVTGVTVSIVNRMFAG